MWGDIVISFMIAFLIAYVTTPYTIRLAKKVGAIDNPKENQRKIHKRIMPRLGGLAIIISFVTSMAYLLTIMSIEKTINLFDADMYIKKICGILGGIVVLGMFCFLDDRKGIKPVVKLIGQSIAAIIVILSGISMDNIEIKIFNTIIVEKVFLNVITFIWIVGITNAINLTDGLDGLASGVSLIGCLSLIGIFIVNDTGGIMAIILSAALAGAIFGFIPYNFNPARTFLGDVGSNFLGFMLAVISIVRNSQNIYNSNNYSTIVNIFITII